MTKKHSQINIHIDQLDILENQFDHNKLSYDFNEYINYQLLGIPLSELFKLTFTVSKKYPKENKNNLFLNLCNTMSIKLLPMILHQNIFFERYWFYF